MDSTGHRASSGSVSDIVLIGPVAAGKSTLGRLLSEALGVRQCSMDEVRWAYYEEIGYDENEQQRIWEREGWPGVSRYWKPFEAHAVERLLSEERAGCVIDFGAGHSVYDDPALFARVRAALAPYINVVLVLPAPDPDEAVRILRERTDGLLAEGFDHAYYVQHPCNHALAKIVVYTEGKLLPQIRDEILSAVAARSQAGAP